MTPSPTRRRALVALSTFTLPIAARSADWPAKPIVLVVPQGPGSGSDVTARFLAQHLSSILGQPVVVENRTGGSGIIAHQSVARAPADGYTILSSSTAQLLVVPTMNTAAKYSLDDFVPVAPIIQTPFFILVANTQNSPRTLKELVEKVRSQPSAFASAGRGTMTHLVTEIFLGRAGLKATHVPYKGSGAALTDLIGGQMLFASDSPGAAMTYLRSGHLRALATTGPRREETFPDVPTLVEAGVPGDPIVLISGFFAPKGLPREIADRLGKAVDMVMRNPEVVQKFASMSAGMLRYSNEAFMNQLRREAPSWQGLVRQLGITVDS